MLHVVYMINNTFHYKEVSKNTTYTYKILQEYTITFMIDILVACRITVD